MQWCSLLVEKYSFFHLSAGHLIRTFICEGTIVPIGVKIKVLENAMGAVLESKCGSGLETGKGRFLIDVFPRTMD
jgi:adenylate kinase family enzyme